MTDFIETDYPYPAPGTVSWGTLRTEDLIAAFEAELLRITGSVPDAELDEDDYLNLLSDALESIAPPGHYFGAHPGDGSNFGFWLADN